APKVLAAVGMAPAGHGHESAGHDASHSAAAWATWLGVIVVGGVLGAVASPVFNYLMGYFFVGFNWVFERLSVGYSRLVRGLLHVIFVMLLIYGGLIALTVVGFRAVPTGFIPQQDKGYLVINAQLPDGSSLERTDAVVRQITDIARADEGVAHVIGL